MPSAWVLPTARCLGGMTMLLARVLAPVLGEGQLTIIDEAGRLHRIEGPRAGPSVTLRIHTWWTGMRLALRPRLALGEAYMDGTLTVEEGSDIYDLLDLIGRNITALEATPMVRLSFTVQRWLRVLEQYNPIGKAQRNVAHHYDLKDQLYDFFLDRDRQYSCAYFKTGEEPLEQAQLDKKRHIAAKLLLQPGQRVLDIGSGWGGLALYLAAECGADVSGLTLSEEQHKVATRRAAAAGLGNRVRFHLRDYREEKGRYDRIVSVGMLEHVGVNQYKAFFRGLSDMLAPDGVALLHSIGRMDGPGTTNPWLRKYIFPGGYSPALSEVVPEVESARLWITDIEILRLHYADTLGAWRRRFEQNRDRIRALYDERFCRMWEMYLVGSELAFRRDFSLVFQMQLAKRVDTVPITRDYMIDWERARRVAALKPAGRAA